MATKEGLPRFRPSQRDTVVIFQAQEGKYADVVVAAVGKSADNALMRQVSERFVAEGLQTYLDPTKGIAVGLRQRPPGSSSSG